MAAEIAPFGGFVEFNAYRRKLLQLRLIGVDSNGVGFGNLSIRDGATNNFYITGSATGGIPELTLAVRDSLIRVADTRRGLRGGCKSWGGYPLPRLKIVGSASKSSSDKLEGR